MDMIDHLTPSEIRAAIFSCKIELCQLKEKRKKYHKEIRNAKNLIKGIERSIDTMCDSELAQLEVSSAVLFLRYLRETLEQLDYFWEMEVEYCHKLHQRLDDLNERVYV